MVLKGLLDLFSLSTGNGCDLITTVHFSCGYIQYASQICMTCAVVLICRRIEVIIMTGSSHANLRRKTIMVLDIPVHV